MKFISKKYPPHFVSTALALMGSTLLFTYQNCSGSFSAMNSEMSSSLASSSILSNGKATGLGFGTLSEAVSQALMAPIVTSTRDGQGIFLDSATGNLFTPRGANYIRLGPNGWHHTFDSGAYDAGRAEAALAYMQGSGYNYVRVFLDGADIGSGFGLNKPGVGDAYLHNVEDFLLRASSHGLRVVLTGPYAPANYQSLIDAEAVPNASGSFNTIILQPGYVKAQAQFLTDLLSSIKSEQPVAINAVMAIDLFNEGAVSLADPPFNQSTGAFVLRGVSYDLAVDRDRQELVDAAMVYWANTLRTAIKSVSSQILVGESVYPPAAVDGTQFNGVHCFVSGCPDPRYPFRPFILMAYSNLDYVDIHEYSKVDAAGNFSIATDFASAELYTGSIWSKPVMMGEFGADHEHFASIASAASVIQTQLRASCDYGFTGWGIWTWDTAEQKEFWSATESGGAMNGVVAPVANPQICQPIPEGLFKVGATVYYSNGSHFCYFDTWDHYVQLTGRNSLDGVASYTRLSAFMIGDGVCH